MSVPYNLIVDECPHCKSSKRIHLFNITSNGLLLIEGRNDHNKDFVLHDLLSEKYNDFYTEKYYLKYTQIHKLSDVFQMINNLKRFYPCYIEDENGDIHTIDEIKNLVKESKKSEALKWIEMVKKDENVQWYEYQLVSNYIVWYASFS